MQPAELLLYDSDPLLENRDIARYRIEVLKGSITDLQERIDTLNPAQLENIKGTRKVKTILEATIIE